MAHYTVEQLLDIYHRVYTHEVQTLVRDGDEREHLDLILALAEFGNQIARMPYDDQTQETARDYVDYIDQVHQNTMIQLEAGDWHHPCECMRSVIHERVAILEHMVEDLSEDDSERADAIWVVYDRWMGHQYRMDSRE